MSRQNPAPVTPTLPSVAAIPAHAAPDPSPVAHSPPMDDALAVLQSGQVDSIVPDATSHVAKPVAAAAGVVPPAPVPPTAAPAQATIACPDCGNRVSPLAELCPHCARPKPALSAQQLSQVKVEAAVAEQKEKDKAEWDNFWGCLGLAYIGNIVLATIAKGASGLFIALFFGPFVWLI